MTAARSGDAEAVALLIAHGAAVNVKETWRGQCALMWAVAEKQATVVELLIKAGADVHARTNKGFTPFLFAVRTGDFGIVRSLLEAGANVNQPGGEGTPPLALAIINAHYELAAFLLDVGADPNADAPGGTALHAAVTHAQLRIRQGRAAGGGANRRISTISLSSGDCSTYGANVDARIVKPLPRQGGFDNNYLPLVGATPFLLAARAADPATMRLLLEYGADPFLPTNQKCHAVDGGGGTWATCRGRASGPERERLEAVKLLVELGADIQATTDSGETAMHGAATGGVNDVVQLLVDKRREARCEEPRRQDASVNRRRHEAQLPHVAAHCRAPPPAAGAGPEAVAVTSPAIPDAARRVGRREPHDAPADSRRRARRRRAG